MKSGKATRRKEVGWKEKSYLKFLPHKAFRLLFLLFLFQCKHNLLIPALFKGTTEICLNGTFTTLENGSTFSPSSFSSCYVLSSRIRLIHC